jgi:hypothetical protein
MSWAGQTSKYWSSYGILTPGGNEGEYYFMIAEALYVGTSEEEGDYSSFENTFKEIFPKNRIFEDTKMFDTFHQKTLNQDPEPIGTVSPMVNLLSVFINQTMSTVRINCFKEIYIIIQHTDVINGAPPIHRVLKHQQRKNRVFKHRLPKTSIGNKIDCPKHRSSKTSTA